MRILVNLLQCLINPRMTERLNTNLLCKLVFVALYMMGLGLMYGNQG